MAEDTFTAPCGCTWYGGQHHQACDAWETLIAARDALRQGDNVGYWDVRTLEEQMEDHMPPWMISEDG